MSVRVGVVDDGDGDGVRLFVEDDGSGIPPEDRDRVLEDGYSTAEDGTGLGLAVVERVVEAHGWLIGVGESAEGGARFEIGGVTRLSD